MHKYVTRFAEGDRNDVTRDVKYARNGLTATYMCQGTTLDYHCSLD